MTTRYVRLRDANPAINPGWLTPEQYAAEVSKTPRDMNRRIKIVLPD